MGQLEKNYGMVMKTNQNRAMPIDMVAHADRHDSFCVQMEGKFVPMSQHQLGIEVRPTRHAYWHDPHANRHGAFFPWFHFRFVGDLPRSLNTTSSSRTQIHSPQLNEIEEQTVEGCEAATSFEVV